MTEQHIVQKCLGDTKHIADERIDIIIFVFQTFGLEDTKIQENFNCFLSALPKDLILYHWNQMQ